MRLSTEKNKKKLLTVRVGLFSLREKAPTKNRTKRWKQKFEKFFEMNHTVKEIEVDTHLQPDAKIQQKARLITVHLQDAVGANLERFLESVHIEKATKQNKFVKKLTQEKN